MLTTIVVIARISYFCAVQLANLKIIDKSKD
jgi:hypothetical protein